jgi:hypothetical protein
MKRSGRVSQLSAGHPYRGLAMFDVIDFLENAGQDAQWRQADTEARAAALAGAEIPPELRAAMLAGDAQGLNAVLGQVAFCCYINPAKQDEDEGGQDDKDKKDKNGENKEEKNDNKPDSVEKHPAKKSGE